MRALALVWLGITVAGCGGAGVFACSQSDECGVGGVCEANGFCSFPDGECPSNQRYGEHAPSGIAGACVEPVDGTSTGMPSDTGSPSSTTVPATTLTDATLEGDGPTSAAESSSSSSSSTGTPDDSHDSGIESSTGDASKEVGPIVIGDDADDGTIWPGDGMRMGTWLPSGEMPPGLAFCGEYPLNQRYFAYLRFAMPEALPADSIIETATLEMFGHSIYLWDETHALRVWAQLGPDAPTVTGVADYPGVGAVQLGDISVRWADADDTGLTWEFPGVNASPDLAPVVQELVDANMGLAAGAHVQLWVAEDDLGGMMGEEVGWYDSSAGPETAAQLTFVYH